MSRRNEEFRDKLSTCLKCFSGSTRANTTTLVQDELRTILNHYCPPSVELRFTGLLAEDFRQWTAVEDDIPDEAELWAHGFLSPLITNDGKNLRVYIKPIDYEWIAPDGIEDEGEQPLDGA